MITCILAVKSITANSRLQLMHMVTVKKENICVWSSPRNVSTALMYSFSQRCDIKVMDEPLYAHYLKNYDGPPHPMQKDIIKNMEIDKQKLINQTILPQKKILWHKMMTKHISGMGLEFLKKVRNVLLIRDPRAIIYSYSKVMTEVTKEDIAIDTQRMIYDYLSEAGHSVTIIDSSDILKDPEAILKILCNKLDLEWDTEMLHWPKGPIEEDGIWAPVWYNNVHNSTGFKPYTKPEISLSEELEIIAEECRGDYDYLYNLSIKK